MTYSFEDISNNPDEERPLVVLAGSNVAAQTYVSSSMERSLGQTALT